MSAPAAQPAKALVHHRCKVHESGPTSYYAYCQPRRGKCKYKGERRSTLLAAWMDARKHDPTFPQGDSPAERNAA